MRVSLEKESMISQLKENFAKVLFAMISVIIEILFCLFMLNVFGKIHFT